MRLVVKDKKELEEVIKSLGLKNEDELWEVLPIVVDEDMTLLNRLVGILTRGLEKITIVA